MKTPQNKTGIEPEPRSGSLDAVVSQHLEQSGWHKYQTHRGDIWCKRWKDAARCKCNASQAGIQVVITVNEYEGRLSYEMDVTGEKPDGAWAKLSAYSFNAEEIIQASETQASQLVAAWNLLANSYSAEKKL